MSNLAHIRIKRKTRTRLKGYGKKGDTWDEIIKKVLDYMDQAGAEGGTPPD